MTRLSIGKDKFVLLSDSEFNALGAQTVGRAEICEHYGIKASTLAEQPWRLPNFGRDSQGHSVAGIRNYKYLAKDFLNWISIPEEERKRRYKSGSF